MSDHTPSLRICIDGNEANVTKRVGSNEYAFQLLTALAAVLKDRADVHITVALATQPQRDLPKGSSRWKYVVFGPTQFWTQLALPIHLYFHKDEYDIFFTPGHYAPRWSSVPYISSVMDLAFLKYPKQFRRKDTLQLTNWTSYSVRRAQKIITISQFSKSEIVRLYKIPREKIAIAYPAVQDPEKLTKGTVRKVLRKFHIETPYLLYVGTLQPRKNLEKLVDAYEVVLQEQKASMHRDELPQLVLAGKAGWLTEHILQHIQVSPAKKHITLTGYVSETEKQALLQDATAVVQVGLYEGFGIPVLEALKNEKPVVVSDTSSLPEVAGEAGIYVQADSVDSIAGGLRRALSLNAKERAHIEKLSREHARQFDWQKSAEVVVETLESVVKSLRKP